MSMTPRQQAALAVFTAVLAALLAAVREGTKVPLPAFVVLSVAAVSSLAYLLFTFDKLPLRAIFVFVGAIGGVVCLLIGWRTYQDNVIPSDVQRLREEVRTIELALERGDTCALEVRLSDPADPATAHRVWMRYAASTRDVLSEEIAEGVKLYRSFIKNGKVIASEEPVEGGRFRIQYIKDECLVAIDYLDNNRIPTELEYFGGCGMTARRLGPSSIWFWPKENEPFKAAIEPRGCSAAFRRDPNGPPNRQVIPVPTPGFGYR
jgi:multidrug transporter EmrE-like cation transporter